MTRAVLVNGVPATGKSSIARAVGARLELPVLSLDSIKEALFDELGDADGDREFGRALGRASMQAIWSVVAGFPPTAAVVIEAWFRLPPHDAVVEGLRRAGIERWAEIWCHASVDVLVARYAARTRHPGHPPASYTSRARAACRNGGTDGNRGIPFRRHLGLRNGGPGRDRGVGWPPAGSDAGRG